LDTPFILTPPVFDKKITPIVVIGKSQAAVISKELRILPVVKMYSILDPAL
jgi:hypothetical protein